MDLHGLDSAAAHRPSGGALGKPKSSAGSARYGRALRLNSRSPRPPLNSILHLHYVGHDTALHSRNRRRPAPPSQRL
jgi:hypothetical protein